MQVEEYEMVKCPWCSKAVVVKNNIMATHRAFRDGLICPGSKKPQSVVNELIYQKDKLDSH